MSFNEKKFTKHPYHLCEKVIASLNLNFLLHLLAAITAIKCCL
uniref:Uncharacterized protein n=1 Tax=Anguilla anguilla TaxID=7936 RepID=A0A0E9PCW7_ANGAN